jgi:hypothetical protein
MMVQEKIRDAQTKSLARLNLNARSIQYSVGDLVLIRKHEIQSYEQRKWSPKYDGPYTVKKLIGPVVLEVENNKTKKVDLVHVAYVRPFRQQSPHVSPSTTDDDDSDSEEEEIVVEQESVVRPSSIVINQQITPEVPLVSEPQSRNEIEDLSVDESSSEVEGRPETTPSRLIRNVRQLLMPRRPEPSPQYTRYTTTPPTPPPLPKPQSKPQKSRLERMGLGFSSSPPPEEPVQREEPVDDSVYPPTHRLAGKPKPVYREKRVYKKKGKE